MDAKACASCVPYPGSVTKLALPALGSCMSCVEGKGKRFTGACLTCAASKEPGKCITCLDSFYPKLICRTNEYVDCYKPDFDNPCATCQNVGGGSYEQCISCYSRPKSKPDCDNCAVLSTQTAQQQCFTCSAKEPGSSSSSPGGCGTCFTHSKNPATLSQCLQCITSSSVNHALHQYCNLCASPELSEPQGNRCFKCLAGKDGGPACSMCARSASNEAAFAACMSCRANPANTPDCRDCDTLGSGLPVADAEALRKKCYECVSASKLVVPPNAGSAPLGSCQACFSVKGADVGQCVACNGNSAVPSLAKGACVDCSTKAAGARDTCVKCLASSSNSKLTSAYDFRKKCSV